MKNKHLIVLSVDALVYEDLEYARTLPNFKKLLEGGSLIKRVKTIYPSLTHPVHATILTGAPAGKTGIVRNERFCPGKVAPWYNLLGEIQCETILHAAKAAGLTTAVSTWPVTAKGEEVVDYLIPGILNEYSDGREHEILEVYREYGARESVIDIVKDGIERFGSKDVHPEYDSFQVYCASRIIERFKPNMIFVHPSHVDSARHKTGVFSEEVKHAVEIADEYIGELLAAVYRAGISDTCDFILLSDHGQLDIDRCVLPNLLLKDAGYIKVDKNGDIESWNAYTCAGGLSAHVYLSRPEDKQLYNNVYSLLSKCAKSGEYGFERVFTTEEVRDLYGLDGEFSFVLETDGHTAFHEGLMPPYVRDTNNGDYRISKATHGHLPEKGPQPTFIACGPSFKPGVVIEEGSILDHAPTFARVFGLSLPDAEGTFVKEIFKD